MAGLLSRVTSVAKVLPPRVFLYAREKWGKSSLFAHAPGAIFFMTRGETGLSALIAGGRVPPTAHFEYDEQAPPTWKMLRDAVRELRDEDHPYRYFVLDTANGAEMLCQDHVRNAKPFGGNVHAFQAYGKGMEACRVEWHGFLQDLDALQAKREMTIVLLAHTQVKKFDDPTADESYDKYKPACAEKLWDLTHKWADIICFGHFETKTYESDSGKTKAKNELNRVLCFDQSPSYEAGNRYGITGKLEVGGGADVAFADFARTVAEAQSAGAVVWTKAEFAALLKLKGKEWKNALNWIDKNYRTTHVEAKASFETVPPVHVAAYALWLKDRPDVEPAPAPEGEQRPDPITTTSPTAETVPSVAASNSPASAETPSATDAPKTMPAAEQRTAEPVVSDLPGPGAEFARWADAKDAELVAAKLRTKGGVKRWLELLRDRRKLDKDLAKWTPLHVGDAVVIIGVYELILRNGKEWGTTCLPWINETQLQNYPRHTAVEAVMPIHLQALAAALRDNPDGVQAPSEEMAGAAS